MQEKDVMLVYSLLSVSAEWRKTIIHPTNDIKNPQAFLDAFFSVVEKYVNDAIQSDGSRRCEMPPQLVEMLPLFVELSTSAMKPLEVIRRGMQRVRTGLFIGGKHCANQPKMLRYFGVRRIVQCLAITPLPTGDGYRAIQQLNVPLVDDRSFDVRPHLTDAVFSFIREGVEEGGVLIYCSAGMHRSTVVMAAFMLVEDHCAGKKTSVASVLAEIAAVRPMACPPDYFMAALHSFEADLAQRN